MSSTKPQICRSKNPSTCKYHGVPLNTHVLSDTPPMYVTVPSQFNMDEEKFDDMEYIAAATHYLKQLPEAEIKAVNHYVQSGYDEINSALYGNAPVTNEIKKHVRLLDSALKTAPQAPPVLWRSLSGFNLPTKFLAENHQVGDVIRFDGYTSTSQTPSAIMHMANETGWYMRTVPQEEWEFDPRNEYMVVPPASYTDAPARNVLFMIKTRTAAPVSVLRGTVAEQEWLIPRGKQYKITDIQTNRSLNGTNLWGTPRATVFVLEEV